MPGLEWLGPVGQEGGDMAVARLAGLGLGKRRPPCLRRAARFRGRPGLTGLGARLELGRRRGWVLMMMWQML